MNLRFQALACVALALAACSPDTPERGDTIAAPAGTAAPAATSGIVAASTAQAAVEASMDRFLAARSFHAEMAVEGAQPMSTQMDFVAPDRYRMTLPVGTQVIIGDTMYMQMHGKTMKVPLPEATLAQWRDPLKFQQGKQGLEVEAQGVEPVEGRQARKYLVRHAGPQGGEFTYWIGADGLPVQLRHHGGSNDSAFTMTIRYSRFDDPSIRVEAPQ